MSGPIKLLGATHRLIKLGYRSRAADLLSLAFEQYLPAYRLPECYWDCFNRLLGESHEPANVVVS